MWSGEDSNWSQNAHHPWPPSTQFPVGSVQAAACPSYPTEQVDWAALAQQWIRMQQQPSQVPLNEDVQPPGEELHHVSNSNGNNVPPLQDVDYRNNDRAAPLQQQQYWDASVDNDMWNSTVTNQPWTGPDTAPKKTFDYGHTHGQSNPIAASVNMAAAKTFDYNHGGSDQYSYDQPSYDEDYWNQKSSSDVPFVKHSENRVEQVADSSQIDMVKRKQLPPWIREGLEKMEREKQKKLDQERFEQERLENLKKKKEEEEAALSEMKEGSLHSRSKFDSDSESEHLEPEKKLPVPDAEPDESGSPVASQPASPVVREPDPPQMTEVERQQDLIFRVRKMLTQILLEVTNEQIRIISSDVLRKARSQSLAAKQLASSTALASIAGNLGLGNYESDSEDSAAEVDKVDDDDDQDSDDSDIKEIARKKLFEFERLQSQRLMEEEELPQDSKSVTVSESNTTVANDQSCATEMGHRVEDNEEPEKSSTDDAHNVDDTSDLTTKYHFEKQYSEIPGLDPSVIIQESEEEKSKAESKLSAKKTKQTSVKRKKRSRSKSSEKGSKSRRRSRSRSKGRKRSRRSYSRDRRSRSRDKYRRSRSCEKKYKRSRSREGRRYKSRSKSYDRYRKSRKHSRSSSGDRYNRSYTRSRSRDRYNKSKKSSRRRSKSISPKRSKKKSGKSSKSGKKS